MLRVSFPDLAYPDVALFPGDTERPRTDRGFSRDRGGIGPIRARGLQPRIRPSRPRPHSAVPRARGDGRHRLAPELPIAASASDVGGTVLLRLSTPATGRYAMAWFTRLPPNSNGEDQVDVYSATVYGI